MVFSRISQATFKVGNSDIYVKELDGGIARPLTEGPANDNNASWTSDGSRIIFVRSVEGERALYETRLTGRPGDEQLLLQLKDAEIDQPGTSCSPDGKYVAFVDRESPEASQRIYLLSTETQETTPLTSPPAGLRDFHPLFSPDGKKLAFARASIPESQVGDDWIKRADLGWNIWLVPIDGGEEQRVLTKDEKIAWGFAWTGDGEEIIYAPGKQNPRLWRASISSGESYPLLTEGRYVWPGISPRGDRLAYTRIDWVQDIWRLSLSRETREPGVPSQSRLIESPSLRPDISPDGQWITFSSDRSGQGSEIWVCDSDGNNPKRLARGDDPHWSPNGDYIAFSQWEEDRGTVISTIHRDKRALLSLTEGEFPSWSEDGRCIYFNRDGSLWKISADGGEQPIQMPAEADRWCVERGSFVYYRRGADFWRIPREGGPEELLLEDMGETSWGVGKSGIYYVNLKTDPVEFRKFDLKTRKNELVEQAVGEVGKWERLSVSPDEQWLVYPIQKFPTDIFMIENFH